MKYVPKLWEFTDKKGNKVIVKNQGKKTIKYIIIKKGI